MSTRTRRLRFSLRPGCGPSACGLWGITLAQHPPGHAPSGLAGGALTAWLMAGQTRRQPWRRRDSRHGGGGETAVAEARQPETSRRLIRVRVCGSSNSAAHPSLCRVLRLIRPLTQDCGSSESAAHPNPRPARSAVRILPGNEIFIGNLETLQCEIKVSECMASWLRMHNRVSSSCRCCKCYIILSPRDHCLQAGSNKVWHFHTSLKPRLNGFYFPAFAVRRNSQSCGVLKVHYNWILI
jgi:hypothetical protein